MSFETEGHIKLITELQTFESGFTKQEVVVTTEEQYPQDIKIEFHKERTAILEKFMEGEKVKVRWNLRGNEHNDKYYVNLVGWKIEPVSGSAPAPAPAQAASAKPAAPPAP